MSEAQSIQEFVNNNNARIEQIMNIGGMLVDDYCWPDALENFFMDDPDEAWKVLDMEPPEDDEDKESVAEHLMDKGVTGFLIQVSHPIPHNFSRSGYSCSWGAYATRWVYGETVAECMGKADIWCKQFLERQRQKKETAPLQGGRE